MELPDDTKRFLLDNFDSVVELEGLLLIRLNAQVAWSSPILSRRLYVSLAACDGILHRLHEMGFIEQVGTPAALSFVYKPLSPEQLNAVERVASLQSSHRIAIISLLHEKPGPVR